MTTFYVPLESGYWKLFSLPFDSFWCCTGTGVESFAKLADSIFFHDDDSLYVNLFVPARLHWPEKGLFVRQETRFPDDDRIHLEFQCEKPVALSLRVRVPYWATRGIAVRVNGETQDASREAVQLLDDRADLEERRPPGGEPAHGACTRTRCPTTRRCRPSCTAPWCWPAALGNEGLTYEMMYADPVNARRGEGMRGQPVPAPDLMAPSADPGDWIRPVGDSSVDRRDVEVVAGSPGDWTRAAAEGGLAFRITGQPRPLSLVPLNRLFGQRFAVYWRVKPA